MWEDGIIEELLQEMSSSLKKTVLSNGDIQLPVYKKLPPIHNPPVVSGRQIMSPSMVTVDFTPNGKKVSNVTNSQNVPMRNHSSSSQKLTNQSPVVRSPVAKSPVAKSPVGGKPLAKGSSNVALSNSPKGIELVGFKLSSDKSEGSSPSSVTSEKKPETNGWTPLSSELPPCKICGDKASGLHYGVNTCEACKAFFRRTLKKTKVEFMCSCSLEEKKLGSDFPRKFSCGKCRYERCIKVGMSKDAIKIGRYTITRKRQNDREVKSFKENSNGRKLSESSSKSSSSLSPYSTGQSVSSPEELSNDITSLNLQTPMKTQQARKRRADDNDPEDGFLYRSLTNSIIMSLIENQNKGPKEIPSSELFPVEIVMSYNEVPPEDDEPSALERLLRADSADGRTQEQIMQQASPGQEQTSIEKLLSTEFTAPEFHGMTEENSFTQLLADSVPPEPVLEQSPIEKLLMSGGDDNTNFQDIPIKSFDLVPDSSPDILSGPEDPISQLLDQSQVNGQGHLHIKGQHKTIINIKPDPHTGVHYSTVSSINTGYSPVNEVKESPIESLLKGIKPSVPQVQQSPIETLLMAPTDSNLQPDHKDLCPLPSSINMNQPLKQEGVYDPGSDFNDVKQFTYDDDDQHVLYGVNVGNPINTKPENCQDNVLIATKIDPSLNEPFNDAQELIKQDLEGDIYTADNLEDLEIQMQQLNRFENPALMVGQGLSLEHAQQIVVTLLRASIVLFDTHVFSCEEIKKRHSEYLEQYTLKKQVFGNMSNVSKEEYLDFYNQTGIEIDNRQQILIESLKYIEDTIYKLAQFAKSIPGFAELDIDDQVNLVKVSRLEFQLIKMPKIGTCLRSKGQITTTPWLKEYHIEEITRIYPAEFLDTKMSLVREVSMLSLTNVESILLRAIIITIPDRCVLKEPQKVEKIHDKLIACFLHLLSKRPPEKELSVRTIMRILFRLRDLAAWDTQVVQELFEVWPASSNHQLAKAVVS